MVSLAIDWKGFLTTDMGFMIPEKGYEENYAAFTFTIVPEE